MNEKKNIIMDSQILTSLMACPRKADFRFNLNLVQKGGKSNSLECGSLVHKILEVYFKGLMNGKFKSVSIDEAFDAGMEYIRNGEDGTGLKSTPEDNDENRLGWKFVLETMRMYFDYYKREDWTVLGVEQTRGKVLYEDEEMRILWKAKFDLIVDTNADAISIDHKTMKMTEDTLSMNNQFMGQCSLLNARSIVINKIGFQKTLPPEKRFIRATISYSKNRLDEWINDILPFYARMLIAYNEVGYYPPNFTHCKSRYGNCEFKGVCELDKNMRETYLKDNYVSSPWDISND